MAKFISWLKKHHFIHSWGKWELQKVTMHYHDGKDIKSDVQIRTCQTCGRIEKSEL